MGSEPVPFQVALPRRDTLGLDGARSVRSRVHGLVHFDGNIVTFEWSTSRRVEQISLTGVGVVDDVTVPDLLDVPAAWIADARLTGGWWAPRLRLRGRRLDAFDGVPGAGQGTLVLLIARRDRVIATAMADALTRARLLGPAESGPELLGGPPQR